jgi:hypothetical protein
MNTTRAPWHVSGDLSTAVDVYAGTIRIAMLDDEVEIPDHELIANARLIAAAPDLLAALCDLLDEADLNEVDEYTAPKIEAARAAIARATCDQTMPT